MNKTGITGISDLIKLQNKVKQNDIRLRSLNGTKVDLDFIDFVPGPVLHQDGESATEQESALFEKENPQIVAFMQSLQHQIEGTFRG